MSRLDRRSTTPSLHPPSRSPISRLAFGTAAGFVVVLLGATGCSRGSSNVDSTGTATSKPPDTTVAPPTVGPATGSYAIIEAVNLRPGMTSKGKTMGKIPAGTAVVVQCVGKGETAQRNNKSDARWDKVTYNAMTGFVSNAYVDTKADIDDPKKIPPC